MKKNFYSRLAWQGIEKNKRLYIPFLITGSAMVMMNYIVMFLASSDMLEYMKGGGDLAALLPYGNGVIALFSLVFMFYSNSFIIRQRNSEFGLYYVLGLNRNNLCRIILTENVISASISVFGGLISGIVFSKLAELIMCRLLDGVVSYSLKIDFTSAVMTALIFFGIFSVLLINSLIKVYRNNPLKLMKSSNIGEKAPKANWIIALLGTVMLGVAYYIAITVKQPLTAMIWFFAAVVLVIIATYLLFISGSVALCKLLQKNKKYYYKSNHFVSVSSMAYRMKRNGAGLASICILITMVLVMVTATLSMYIGAEDSLMNLNPRDISVRLNVPETEEFNEETFASACSRLDAVVGEKENDLQYSCVQVPGYFTDDGLIIDQTNFNELGLSYENVGYLAIMTLDDYNMIMGKEETLKSDECFIYENRFNYKGKTIAIEDGNPQKIVKELDDMYVPAMIAGNTVPTIIVITDNQQEFISQINTIEERLQSPLSEMFYCYDFDLDATAEEKIEVFKKINANISNIGIKAQDGSYGYGIDCREEQRTAFFDMYSALLFIGILLSIVFLLATVLIIYYKQIIEGYEDKDRFNIMLKVGMTDTDVRKSVNSQLLTVFFSPLAFAGLHLGFAFPIVWRLMHLLGFGNLPLMIAVTVICFVIFALIYALVYKITSNGYYSIVSQKHGN